MVSRERPSLLDMEMEPGRAPAQREDLINLFGRSPTAVFEAREARRWMAPFVEAVMESAPDDAYRRDLASLLALLETQGGSTAFLTLDNRLANWSVAMATARPHALALELAHTMDVATVVDPSTLFDAQGVASVSMYRGPAPNYTLQINPVDTLLRLVTDSRSGVLLATSNPGEANRANTQLASNRMATYEVPRLNERLRAALAQPPPDDRTIQGALDLSRSMRNLDPQVAVWVQRMLGLPNREGTLNFTIRDEGDGISWRATPQPSLVAAGPAQGAAAEADDAGPRTDAGVELLPFFLELPRDGAQIAVAVERGEAAVLLASYHELVSGGGSRSALPMADSFDQLLIEQTGISIQSTVMPLLGRRCALVVYPGGTDDDGAESPSTILLVVETRDEMTLGRLAERIVATAAPLASDRASLIQDLGLATASGELVWGVKPERLALVAGPEATARLAQWQAMGTPAEEAAPSTATTRHLALERASLLGWAESTTDDDQSRMAGRGVGAWWAMENLPSGPLEIRGWIDASPGELATAAVAAMPIFQPADPKIVDRVATARRRMEAADAAMRRYWERHGQMCRTMEALVADQPRPPDFLDPFTDPPQLLAMRLLGTTRWVIASVGPDLVPDPEDMVYNPRLGVLSRGDILRYGWVPSTEEASVTETPSSP